MKFKGEAFHSCEQWLERVAYLRGTDGLLAERLALYLHKERIRACALEVQVHDYGDKLFVKSAGCADGLQQAIEIERKLVEELDVER